jgi:hypothetical protein
MKSSQQLERETELSRAQVEHTLEELRARLTPGQVVDQFVDYAREGKAGLFFSNLGQQAVNNPLPVAIIGASLAWLMMSNGGAPGQAVRRGDHIGKRGMKAFSSVVTAARNAADAATDIAGSVGDAAHATADTISEAAHSASASVRDVSARIGESTSAAAARLSESAASTYEGATSRTSSATAAFASSASELRHDTMQSARGLVAFCKEQPLVLTGIGLAIGAAIGAAFPSTETEDRLMGAASDTAKGPFKDAISEHETKADGSGPQDGDSNDTSAGDDQRALRASDSRQTDAERQTVSGAVSGATRQS